MIIINRQGKDGEIISGSLNGKQFSVSFDATKYQMMLDLQDRAEEAKTMDDLKAIVAEFEPLTVESYKELVETKCPFIMVNKSSNKFFLKYADKVSRIPMPKVWADKIIKSVEKDISPMPAVKCWVRYIREVPGRPKFSERAAANFAAYVGAPYINNAMKADLEANHGVSADVATDRSTTDQVAITQEGLLVCYKVSTEITEKFIKDPNSPNGVKKVDRNDFDVDEITGDKTFILPEVVEDRIFEPRCMGQGGDPFLITGPDGIGKLGHVIKVGCVHELQDWKRVGPPGGPGLHVGGLRYIQGYQNSPGAVTHNIFVDPMDIHTVGGLGYGSDGAMTVRRYFVHSSFAGVNKNIYHSSTYAAMTDAEWAKIIEEVVTATQEKKADLDEKLLEAKALKNASKATKDGNEAMSSGQVFGS